MIIIIFFIKMQRHNLSLTVPTKNFFALHSPPNRITEIFSFLDKGRPNLNQRQADSENSGS
jgi:hypothetical protein